MKILLDENLPHALRAMLSPHEVFTTAFLGWTGIRNGELLARAAQNGFDAVISLDAGIEFEQNLKSIPCSLVILTAQSNRLRHIRPLVVPLLAALAVLPARSLMHAP